MLPYPLCRLGGRRGGPDKIGPGRPIAAASCSRGDDRRGTPEGRALRSWKETSPRLESRSLHFPPPRTPPAESAGRVLAGIECEHRPCDSRRLTRRVWLCVRFVDSGHSNGGIRRTGMPLGWPPVKFEGSEEGRRGALLTHGPATQTPNEMVLPVRIGLHGSIAHRGNARGDFNGAYDRSGRITQTRSTQCSGGLALRSSVPPRPSGPSTRRMHGSASRVVPPGGGVPGGVGVIRSGSCWRTCWDCWWQRRSCISSGPTGQR